MKRRLKNLLSKLCTRMINRSHILYCKDKITYEQAWNKSFFWRTIRAKWVYDECHHLCCFCDFKYECWSNAKEK